MQAPYFAVTVWRRGGHVPHESYRFAEQQGAERFLPVLLRSGDFGRSVIEWIGRSTCHVVAERRYR